MSCSFKSIDWYWGLFSGSNFIGCYLANCTFAGTGLPDTLVHRLVSLVNCKVHERQRRWRLVDLSKTIGYGCSVESCLGFEPSISTAIPSV